jgi:hypothetical protein
MQGKGAGPVNRVELESQVLCAALRQSCHVRDKIGAFTAIRELSHLFPDLLPPPERDDEQSCCNKANFYHVLNIKPQTAANGVIAAYIRNVRRFLRAYKITDHRTEFNKILNAGFILRKPRLRLSHDLVVARRWLHEESRLAAMTTGVTVESGVPTLPMGHEALTERQISREVTTEQLPALQPEVPASTPVVQPMVAEPPAAAKATPSPAAAQPDGGGQPVAAPAIAPPVSPAVLSPLVAASPPATAPSAVPAPAQTPSPSAVPPMPPLPVAASAADDGFTTAPTAVPVAQQPAPVAGDSVAPPVVPAPVHAASTAVAEPPAAVQSPSAVPSIPLELQPHATLAPVSGGLQSYEKPAQPDAAPLGGATASGAAVSAGMSSLIEHMEQPSHHQPAAIEPGMPSPVAGSPPFSAAQMPSAQLFEPEIAAHAPTAHSAEPEMSRSPAAAELQFSASPAQPDYAATGAGVAPQYSPEHGALPAASSEASPAAAQAAPAAEPAAVETGFPPAAMRAQQALERSPQVQAEERPPGRISKEAAFVFDESQLRKPVSAQGQPLPMVVQLLEAAQIISPVEVQALKAQMEFAPNIPVEKHILNAGYVTQSELTSIKLGESLLQQGKITMAQFQVAIYDERNSGLRMAESLQVRGWLSVEVRNAIDEYHRKRQ